jgi:hypothetical protein
MVSTRLNPIEIGIIKTEGTKLLDSIGVHSLKDIPVLFGFLLGGVFIVLHWMVQRIFLFPKRLIRFFVKP